MTAKEMWRAFCAEKNISDAEYEAWAFGDAPDELAELVVKGIKTATASAAALYALEGEPLPQPGDYSVILSSKGAAVCVIQTTKVYTVPFADVDERQAFLEGEGDRSLAYWRQVHEAFFRWELSTAGLTFDEQMEVVCEEFVLAYLP